jgi:tetratricopeptide (TPR) repeat protein
MMGDKRAEVREYQLAAALGLRTWDLFLNIGLAQLEIGELDAATDGLQQAVLLGPNHSESHYNLALAFFRHGRLRHVYPEHEQFAVNAGCCAFSKLDPREK